MEFGIIIIAIIVFIALRPLRDSLGEEIYKVLFNKRKNK